MNYYVESSPDADIDMQKHIKSGNKGVINKINRLCDALAIDPRRGIGKPKRLKHEEGEKWSRKIDDHHRMLYEINVIDENRTDITITALWGHYGDK